MWSESSFYMWYNNYIEYPLFADIPDIVHDASICIAKQGAQSILNLINVITILT